MHVKEFVFLLWIFGTPVLFNFFQSLFDEYGFLIFELVLTFYSESISYSESSTTKSIQSSLRFLPFNSQPHKMEQPMNCLSVFDHFVGLAFKGLSQTKPHVSVHNKLLSIEL